MDILNSQLRKKFDKLTLIVFVIAACIFIVHAILASKKASTIVLAYKFSGIVNQVSYDGKSIPTVFIKNKSYYLGSELWNFNRLITKGDSIQKDSGSMTVKLIKQYSRKKYVFDGTHFYEK